MISINKYGQTLDLSKVVEVNGKKTFSLDGLVVDKSLIIEVPKGTKFSTSLQEDDLKIEFKDADGKIFELILKNMANLLAQNDGTQLVEIVQADDSKVLASITDITSALEAAAAGPAAPANANSDSAANAGFNNDGTNLQNSIYDNARASSELLQTNPTAAVLGGVNITPIIADIGAQIVDEDNTLLIPFTASDSNNDILTSNATALNGTVTITGNVITYIPNANFNGNDTITLTINDGTVTTTQTIAVTVNPVNDTPIILEQVNSLYEDTILNGQLIASDVDTALTDLKYSTSSTIEGFVLNEDGSYSFDANNYDYLAAGETLNLSIPITVTDDFAATASSFLNITLTGTNDRPVIQNIDANGTSTVASSGGGTTTTPDPDLIIGRSAEVGGEVFLGGKFIELGIHSSGSFGTSGSRPAAFYGTDSDSRLGMTSDSDGFAEGNDLRIDYFLPGSPEEAWNLGYKIGGSTFVGTNAGLEGESEIPFSVTNTTSGNTLSASGTGVFNSTLQTNMSISFDANADYYKTTIVLTNNSTSTIDDVRYMKSFDPDNTVYLGGDYTTINKIESTFEAGDGKAIVSATSLAGDNYNTLSGEQSKIFLFSDDSRAKVTTYGFDLRDVYDSNVYDNTLAKGSVVTDDIAISIAFDVGTLAPGESVTISYYTGLTNRDITTVIDEIETRKVIYETHDLRTDLLIDDLNQDSTNSTFEGKISILDLDTNDLGLHTLSILKDAAGKNIIDIAGPKDSSGNDIITSDDITVNVSKNPDNTWNYSIEGNFTALKEGEELTLKFQYVADDTKGFDGTDGINESSISEPKEIKLTITGTNDRPVVSDISSSVTETGNEVLTTFESTLNVSDDDVNDTHTFHLVAGTVTLDGVSVTDSFVSVYLDSATSEWKYKVEGDFNHLNKDQIATLEFKYYAQDDSTGLGESNKSVEKTVTLTITGTNDAPTINLTPAIINRDEFQLDDTGTKHNTTLTVLSDSADALSKFVTDVDSSDVLTYTRGTAPISISFSAPTAGLKANIATDQLDYIKDILVKFFSIPEVSAAYGVDESTVDGMLTGLVSTLSTTAEMQAAINPLISSMGLQISLDSTNGLVLNIANANNFVTLVVDTDGGYSLTSALFDHLGEANVMSVAFDYVATDLQGATVTNTATVNIKGTDDAPTIKKVLTINIDEADLDDDVVTGSKDTTLTVNFDDNESLNNLITDKDITDDHGFYRTADAMGNNNPLSITISAKTAGLIANIGTNQLDYIKDVLVKFISIPEVSAAFNLTPSVIDGMLTTLLSTITTAAEMQAILNPLISSFGLEISLDATTGLELKVIDSSIWESKGLIELVVNTDGGYSLTSALFDHLGVQNTMTIAFDYTAKGPGAGEVSSTVTVEIKGSGDAPTITSVSIPKESVVVDVDTVSIDTQSQFALSNYVKDIDITDDHNFSRLGDRLSFTITNNSAELQDVLTNQSDAIQVNYIKSILVGFISIPAVSLAFGVDAATANDVLSGAINTADIVTTINTLSPTTGLTISIDPINGLQLIVTNGKDWEDKGLISVTLDDNSAGDYSVTSSLFAYLGTSDIMSVSFDYIAKDPAGLKATSSVTVNVQGTNTAPTIQSVTTSIADTTAVDNFAAITGTIVADDMDADDNASTLTYGIKDVVSTTNEVSLPGTYGTLTVNKTTGAYSYEPNDTAINALEDAQTETDSFTITVTDRHGVTTQNTFTVNLTGANDKPVISATDVVTVESSLTDATQELLQTIVTDEDGIVTLNLTTSNSLIVGLFNQVDIESLVKSGILKLLPANYQDNITLDIDTSVAGTVTVNASITGLPDNPFLSVVSQANLKLVLLDHLGSAFNLPFENAVYTGEINVSDVDNILDVKLSLDKISSLTLSTTNKYLITIFEELTSLQPNLSYITNLATDLISGNITLSTTASKTITIPTTAVGLLEKAGLLNILLDETVTNGKAEYKVISPLFNFMKAEDSIKVSFDYKVSDGIAADITDTINVSITGSNDTPVAFADTVNTRFAIGASSYEGTLPGSYAFNMLKGLTITTDLGALKTNIINDIKDNVDVNIDFTAQEQSDIIAELKSKLALTSQDDIVSYLKNIIESSLGAASNATATLTLDSALESFVVSQNVNQIKADVSSLYATKLAALSGIQTTIESVVAAKTLEITVQTFISTFADVSDGKPDITFNPILLNTAIQNYMMTNDLTAFKTALVSSMTNVSSSNIALVMYLANNTPTNPADDITFESFVATLTTAALTNTQANIIASQATILELINTSIFNSLESTFTDFANSGAIETSIKAAISTFTSTYYTADTAGKAAAIVTFKDSVQNILIVNPLAAGAFSLLTEMTLLENAVSISDIQGIDQGTILASLANDITIDSSILNSVLNTALTEIKSYLSTLSLSTLANNPNAIVDTVKDLLDSLFVVIDNVIVDILPTDAELNTTIETALSAEIQTVISDKFAALSPTPSIISAATLDAISSEIATYLSAQALSKINISIDDIKDLALESIFSQFGLDTGLLEKASRDVIAEKMVEDLLTRLSMDEDLVDLATLDYSVVAGSITTVVYDENGVDITSTLTLSSTTVTVDADGSYKVTNASFAALNTLYNIEVKFDYVVNDGNGVAVTTANNDKSESEAQTITLKIALADATVSDGHIKGAFVFEDLNGNKIFDAGEKSTYTDENGNFYLAGATGPLIAIGGNDISTGLAFTGTLTAPAGSTVLSPLTTLIDSLMITGLNLADAKSLVATTLGISSSIDLTTYDSYAIAKDSTSSEAEKTAANDVQKIAVQIVNIMNQTAAATDGSENGLAAITDLVKNGGTVDLTSSETITTILNNSGVTNTNIIQTVANLNQAIKSATNVDEIAKVQVVANDVQNEIQESGTIAEVKTVDAIKTESAAAVINKLPTLEVITNFEISEDNSKTITFTASDLDGTVTTVASAINGTVTVDGVNITYTPNAEYNGVDTITVKTTDDKGAYVVKTIAVSILSANDLPTLDVVSSVSVDEDDNVEVTFSASDVEGIESITTTATNGTVEIIGTNIVYTPNANYNGVDTIVVTVKDNSGSEIVRNIAVTVNDLNDAPTLTVVSTINLNEDGSKTVTFTASDVDGTITTSATASFGTVVINANEITYTPNASFTGNDSIVVVVTDNDGAKVEKTILVEVNDVSFAPVAVAQTINDQVDSFVSYEGYLPGSMLFALTNPQIDLKVGDFLNANTVTVTPTFPVVTETQINMLKAGMIVSLGILNPDGSLGANAISYFDQAKINNLKAVVELIKADVDANKMPDGNINMGYVAMNLNTWVSGITMKLISEFELGEQTPTEITTFNANVINYLYANMTVLTGDTVDFNKVAKDMLSYAKTDFGLTFAEIVNNNIPDSLVAAINNLTAINPMAIVLNIDSALSAYTGSNISVDASAFDSVKTQLSTYLATLNPSDLSDPSVVVAKFATILSGIDTIVAGQSAAAKTNIDAFIVAFDAQITADLNSALDNQIATNVTNFVNTLKAMNPAINTVVLTAQITAAINSLALADATVDISTSLTANDIKTAILSDFGILGNISNNAGKELAAITLADDLATRAGMDGDFEDVSTLTYFLNAGSVDATIDGVDISDVNVTIDPTGAYSITSKSFATLDSANDVNISFDYYLRDQTGKVSEPANVSLNIDLTDSYSTNDSETLDMATLLTNTSGLDELDMTSGEHILSNFTLDEFVSLTDEDNTLKILGDGADTISLDSAQNWKQMMGTDGTTPYTDADGFHVYTTTNASSQTLKLLIEDTITVENV